MAFEMRRGALLILTAAFLGSLGCQGPGSPQTIEISAVDLHDAFMTDSVRAEKQFEGKHLVITGEVAQAFARFYGMTMRGEVVTPSMVYLKTKMDYLPVSVKHVVCRGGFDDLAEGKWIVKPQIKAGQLLRVECSPGIHWSSPALYLSDCHPLLP